MDQIKTHKPAILAAFKCQQTGNCCRADGVVYATPTDIEKMAKILKVDIVSFMNEYVRRRNGQLIVADRFHRPNCFLDDKNRCGVYDARPKHCQTYPDWPEIWESKDALMSEMILCPALALAYKKIHKVT